MADQRAAAKVFGGINCLETSREAARDYLLAPGVEIAFSCRRGCFAAAMRIAKRTAKRVGVITRPAVEFKQPTALRRASSNNKEPMCIYYREPSDGPRPTSNIRKINPTA
jgi:hypothetical protein